MRILHFIKKLPIIKQLIKLLQSIELPRFNNITVWELIRVYVKRIQASQLNIRAASISWQIFMSLFPFLLFFIITLLYLPKHELVEKYFYNDLLDYFFPSDIIDGSKVYLSEKLRTIAQDFKKSSLGVIFISMFIFLVISTNGINSLIKGLSYKVQGFNRKKRTKFKQFAVAFSVTLILTFLLIICLITIYYTDVIWNILVKENPLLVNKEFIVNFAKQLLFLLLLFTGISTIYSYGSEIRLNFKQVYPGAILTTFLFMIIMNLFGFYISEFTRFNFLYGSIGTILIVMIGLNLNIILILIGYELNLAFAKSKTVE